MPYDPLKHYRRSIRLEGYDYSQEGVYYVTIVGAWKSIVTDEYICGVHQLGWQPFYRKLLQRHYWEHLVRDEHELNRIREYISNNPANWETDEENPKNAKTVP